MIRLAISFALLALAAGEFGLLRGAAWFRPMRLSLTARL